MLRSGGTTGYLFDGDRVMADSRADYTDGGVTGIISERASGVSKAYHGDHLGSTRGLTNGSETVTDTCEYDAWGLGIASTGSTATPFGFAGGHGYQRDPDSGLMLLGARYYDPSIGRFISRDPIGYEGGLNLYAYCNGDPVNAVDPDGEDWRWAITIKVVAKLFVGMVVGDTGGGAPTDPGGLGNRTGPRPVRGVPTSGLGPDPPDLPFRKGPLPPPRVSPNWGPPPAEIGVPRGGYRPPIRLGGGGYGSGGGIGAVGTIAGGLGALTEGLRPVVSIRTRFDDYYNGGFEEGTNGAPRISPL